MMPCAHTWHYQCARQWHRCELCAAVYTLEQHVSLGYDSSGFDGLTEDAVTLLHTVSGIHANQVMYG